MRKKIYLAIAEVLKQAAVAKHIGLWNEADEAPQGAVVTEYPAVYVEFAPVQWAQRTARVKFASWRINLHILTDATAAAGAGSPVAEQALAVFDTIDRIVHAIQGLSGDGFNRMQHVETRSDHAHGQLRHDVEGFVCAAEDTSAMRSRTTISPVRTVVRRKA